MSQSLDVMEKVFFSLYRNQKMTDCIFAIGAEDNLVTVKCHKLILSTASSIFCTMLYENKVDLNEPILLSDIEPNIFKKVMEYLYTNCILIESVDEAFEVSNVAKRFLLPNLFDICLDYMENEIENHNASKTYEFAKKNKDNNLMEKAMQYIRCNIKDVLSKNNLITMNFDTFIDIIKQEYLKIASELELIDALLLYYDIMKDNPLVADNLITSMCKVMKNIRFLTLTPKEFIEKFNKSWLLTESHYYEILKKLSSPQTDLSMPNGFCTSTLMRNQEKHIVFCKTPFNEVIEWKINGYFSTQGQRICRISFEVNDTITLLGFQIPTRKTTKRDEYEMNLVVKIWRGNQTYEQLSEFNVKTIVKCNSLADIKIDPPLPIDSLKVLRYWIQIELKNYGTYLLPSKNCNTTVEKAERIFDFKDHEEYNFRAGFIKSLIYTTKFES